MAHKLSPSFKVITQPELSFRFVPLGSVWFVLLLCYLRQALLSLSLFSLSRPQRIKDRTMRVIEFLPSFPRRGKFNRLYINGSPVKHRRVQLASADYSKTQRRNFETSCLARSQIKCFAHERKSDFAYIIT